MVIFVTGGLLVMIHDDVLCYQTWPGAAFTQPGSQIISTRGGGEWALISSNLHLNLNTVFWFGQNFVGISWYLLSVADQIWGDAIRGRGGAWPGDGNEARSQDHSVTVQIQYNRVMSLLHKRSDHVKKSEKEVARMLLQYGCCNNFNCRRDLYGFLHFRIHHFLNYGVFI